MRLAGRVEGARDIGLMLKVELEAQLRADIKAQFAVISMALDERFDQQQANCRSVFTDTTALVSKTFDDIEARMARFPAIPAFPVPAAASLARQPDIGGSMANGSVRDAVRRLEARDLQPNRHEVAPFQVLVSEHERGPYPSDADGLDECCITRTERAYLPEFAGGKRLIVQVQDGFLVDNSELQAMGPGLGFRRS